MLPLHTYERKMSERRTAEMLCVRKGWESERGLTGAPDLLCLPAVFTHTNSRTEHTARRDRKMCCSGAADSGKMPKPLWQTTAAAIDLERSHPNMDGRGRTRTANSETRALDQRALDSVYRVTAQRNLCNNKFADALRKKTYRSL